MTVGAGDSSRGGGSGCILMRRKPVVVGVWTAPLACGLLAIQAAVLVLASGALLRGWRGGSGGDVLGAKRLCVANAS